MHAIPTVIIWEMWKRRNSLRPGKNVTYWMVQSDYLKTIQQLIKTYLPQWKHVPNKWTGSFDLYKTINP